MCGKGGYFSFYSSNSCYPRIGKSKIIISYGGILSGILKNFWGRVVSMNIRKIICFLLLFLFSGGLSFAQSPLQSTFGGYNTKAVEKRVKSFKDDIKIFLILRVPYTISALFC